ncbi:hypothetical protein RJ640_012951 [Escallonia rubra]|uniref:ERCC4 domain-containing protein n=1 Tax=Escallonia rubra TaxID=112253 RepID=A0AA88QTI2_9ASTE|nr:hypothetical protein RJ640_012951 [Escallonia rubra]
MLQFHQHIISDLLEDPTGGLVVLSSGLALHKLISSLLLLHHPSSHGSLLLLSATPSQKHSILSSLPPPPPTPPKFPPTSPSTTASPSTPPTPSSSSPPASSSSTSSPAASLPPQSPASSSSTPIPSPTRAPKPSLSAYSARPVAPCLSVPSPTGLRRWFQVQVSEDLERDPPEVVDIRVPMTGYMVGIQKAVIEVMDACLKEMRKTNKVDVEDLTVENGLFKSFDEIVRRQLDPIWHTLGKKTKQLVSDLKTLRKLLEYLVRYDAVTYLKYLDSLRASESFRSVWIFAESSFKIFEYAKKRVYHFGRSDGVNLVGQSKGVTNRKRKLDSSRDKEDSSSTSTTSKIVLEEVLEEAPKWKLLREVLEEIEEEREKRVLAREELVVEGEDDDSGIVLVACKDEHSCMQLEDCITNGPHKVMREEWEKYLLSKVELRGLPKRDKKKPKEAKGFGVLDGVVPTTPVKKAEVSSISKQENDALLAAASEISKRARKDIVVDDNPTTSLGGGGGGKGRVKGKNKRTSSTDQLSRNTDDTSSNKTAMSEKSETLTSENESHRNDCYLVAGTSGESELRGISADKGVLRKHSISTSTKPFINSKRLPPMHFYALESGRHMLDILNPSVIIVYHPDMAFVREIEIYKAENPSKKLKVYFLFYEDSTEGEKFEASIRRENGAFESLIRQKSLMMLPVDQNGHFLGLNPPIEPQSLTSQNLITRKAGGRKEAQNEMQVIVDMREFMSSLPNVLHQKGMRIIPVTLEVGDYILSPLLCVERKSIQDLFGSFASGRLYHQVEMMARYYKIPVLLIEFSQDKSFSFLSTSDIGDDVTPHSIISKLSLLALHFPRLRIVWSRSLHATAEIFASLKANQDEPDEAKAIRVGVPSEEGIVEDDVRAENYNTSAVEFLRRLPGVTDSNYRGIMDGCKSLAELALLPVERLAEMMGGQKAAKTLRDFLDAKYPTLL